MVKDWSVQKCIKDRANLEAEIEWAQKQDRPSFPVYKKCENIKNNVGWRNFLRQLRP